MRDAPELPILEELRASVHAAALRAEAGAPVPRRRRLPQLPRLALLAAPLVVAACLAALVLPAGDDAPGPSLAERAYAAVAPPARGGIIHVVTESQGWIDGRWQPAAERTEVWIRADGCHGLRRVTRPPGGAVASETEETPRERRTYTADPGVGPATLGGPDAGRPAIVALRRDAEDAFDVRDPLDQFRRLYRQGRVHERGRVTRDGRELIRFVLADAGVAVTYSYLADAETLQPVEYLIESTRVPMRSRLLFRTYERLPADPALLTMRARPGVPVRRGELRTRAKDLPDVSTRPWCF